MSSRVSAPKLASKSAAVLFVLVLCSFVSESQLTQYVQTNLGYRKPYFIFYTVHSAFTIIFFLHLAYLALFTKHSVQEYWNGLRQAITRQLAPNSVANPNHPFPLKKFTTLILLLTVGVSLPGMLWFCAISLAPLPDVTAIWNTNAFFAYVITVMVFGLKWETKKLFSVILATVGVMAVIYGGSSTKDDTASAAATNVKNYSPMIGDLITLVASVCYGFYQVLYKRFATLPNDPEYEVTAYYDEIPSSEEEAGDSDALTDGNWTSDTTGVYPPPFALHPNLLTTLAGIATFLILWIPLPILHYTGLEPFSLPPDLKTAFAISGIALSGVFFNAGFMILLGVWGPIITSVGSLLTIVLVFISDGLVGNGMEPITPWNVLGAGAIAAAFGILAHDVLKTS